jgi:hypothetical protein
LAQFSDCSQLHERLLRKGASDLLVHIRRSRTRLRKKPAIIQMNCWCCKRGLNSRPLPYQGSALPLSYCSIRSASKERWASCHSKEGMARRRGPLPRARMRFNPTLVVKPPPPRGLETMYRRLHPAFPILTIAIHLVRIGLLGPGNGACAFHSLASEGDPACRSLRP